MQWSSRRTSSGSGYDVFLHPTAAPGQAACRFWEKALPETSGYAGVMDAHREGASKYSVPLMMTRCAGVFTPHASVLVATSTYKHKAPQPLRLRTDAQRTLPGNGMCH